MNKDEIKNLSKEEKLELVNNGNLFCKQKFRTGLTKKLVNFFFEVMLSAEFLVWVVFTVLFIFALFKFNLAAVTWIWLVYFGISVIFIIARSIRVVLEQKTTLAIQANATASVTTAITGSISDLIGTVFDKIKGNEKGEKK